MNSLYYLRNNVSTFDSLMLPVARLDLSLESDQVSDWASHLF